jgi:membrane protease YdiL (CAAX protease family)/rhodanese-related sulfurtransferase
MAENPQNSAGFRLAVVVEGGLGIAAVVLAWLFNVSLRDLLPTTWPAAGTAVARGVVATLPLLAGFWWLTSSRSPGLVRLRQQVEAMLEAMFARAPIVELAFIALLAGFTEELLFRGTLQTLFGRWTTPLTGLAIASIVFGLLHALSRLYLVLATLVGAYFGSLTWWYQDLIAPMVAHGLYDFVALVYLTRNRNRQPPKQTEMDMHQHGVKTITVQELYQRHREQPVELIDVRTPEEFREVRVSIARLVPMDTIDPREVMELRTGAPQEPIYFICHLGGRSHHVCEAFIAAGYPNVVNVLGGTEAWEEAGLPVERG